MSTNNKRKKDLLSEMQNDMQIDEKIHNENPLEKVNIVKKVTKIKNVPWYPPNDKLKKELKQLALDEETTMSKLLTEGIGLVFKSRGKTTNL